MALNRKRKLFTVLFFICYLSLVYFISQSYIQENTNPRTQWISVSNVSKKNFTSSSLYLDLGPTLPSVGVSQLPRDAVQLYSAENPAWVGVVVDEMYAYSAFLDERGGQPMVRVLVSADNLTERVCMCRMWRLAAEVHLVHTIHAASQQLPGGRGRSRQYFLLCPTAYTHRENTASHVDIVCDQHPPQNNLLQILPPNIAIKYNFTMCLCPIFGKNVTDFQFIEYLEVNRMLGADHFVIYNMTNTPKTFLPIITAYREAQLMSVYQWDISMKQSFHYFGETVALNDCIYRSMYNSRYMVNTDMDEFIIPLKHHSWAQVLDEMHARNKTADASSYSFLHLFFDSQADAGQTNQTGFFHTVDHMNILTKFSPRFPILGHTTRSKFIGVPQKIILAGIHYVFEGIPGTNTSIVPNDLGLLFHYRNGKTFGVEKQKTGLNPYRMLDFRNSMIHQISGAPFKYQIPAT